MCVEQIEFRLGRIFHSVYACKYLYQSKYVEDAWVDFKSFGLLGMTFVATIISGAYIYRYLPKDDQKMMGINNGYKSYW